MIRLLILLHVLGATIWTGGHLVLALVILPMARRARDARIILEFEAAYERLAVPALLVQLATGPWLALLAKPENVSWSDLATFPVSYVALKLLLVLGILALAVHAKRSVLPRLGAEDFGNYGIHVWAVTLLSVGLVAIGVVLATEGRA
jgi:putative copper export protein